MLPIRPVPDRQDTPSIKTLLVTQIYFTFSQYDLQLPLLQGVKYVKDTGKIEYQMFVVYIPNGI